MELALLVWSIPRNAGQEYGFASHKASKKLLRRESYRALRSI